MKVVLSVALLATISLQADVQKGPCPACSSSMVDQAVEPISVGDVRSMVDKNVVVTIIDARPAKWDNGERVANAMSIPCDAQDEMLLARVPKKDAMIVVYCSNASCAQSKMLISRLKKMGYTQLRDMSEGIEGWKKMGYPTQGSPSQP